MITKYLEVGDNDWGILISYDFDYLNYDEIWSICKSFGMSDKNINKSLRILSSYNTGMAVSSDDLRMSAIFISKATSPSEWWSSCLHELRHSAQAIIDYYGADWGEDDAYLTGFLTKRAVEILGEPCR
jgi:hypothetical protein